VTTNARVAHKVHAMNARMVIIYRIINAWPMGLIFRDYYHSFAAVFAIWASLFIKVIRINNKRN